MKIIPELWEKGEWVDVLHIIADKGYDFSLVRQLIRAKEKHPIIPRREGAIYPGVQDKDKYKTGLLSSTFLGVSKKTREEHCVLTNSTLPFFFSLLSLV
jgi:hypothetical protein